MTNAIVNKLKKFRTDLFAFFTYRADSTMDLIDAIAGQSSKESTVKISLSTLFRRTYSSITDVVDNLFRRKASVNLKPDEQQEAYFEITEFLLEQCPQPSRRLFELIAVDCSSTHRIYSEKLEDRGFVHSPTKVPGQIPITVGHQYSTVVYLPERSDPSEPHWVVPLSTVRVKTEENGAIVGMQQIIAIATSNKFKNKLCVSVNDSAYSHGKCLKSANNENNLINISRLRNNRHFHLPISIVDLEKPKKVGRPKIYGECWTLKIPGEPNEKITEKRFTASGKVLHIQIERWVDRLEKGSNESDPFLFDAVKVTVLKADGTALYKKPLWLMVTGARRRELSLADIADSYFRRFDIEHFFRFGKQKLVLGNFQTPDVRHEENWWWICIFSYVMLYHARLLANQVKYPWETKPKKLDLGKILTPSQVQRDYERIIEEIGTPACLPKPRGKSSGRCKGAQVPHRKNCPIVKKAELLPKNKGLAAA